MREELNKVNDESLKHIEKGDLELYLSLDVLLLYFGGTQFMRRTSGGALSFHQICLYSVLS